MRALLFVVFFASALATNLDVSSRGTLIAVSVATKDSTHPYFGQGNPNAYVMNGTQGATLIVTAGQTYRFDLGGVTCNHPIYFTFDPSGQGSLDFSTGVVASNYNASCRGQTLSWTVPSSLISQTLYYQCRFHSKMGYQIKVNPPTICNKYSIALNMTNNALVGFVVSSVVGIITQPSHPLSNFFDGTTPPGSTNYTSPSQSVAFTRLFTNLVAFFGGALGCSDGTIGRYNGPPDLLAVHAPMQLDQFEFDTFNNVLLGVLQSAGVTPQDLALVLSVLRTTKPVICTVGQCRSRTSICDRYADALNLTNVDLVTYLVVQTFGGLIAGSLRPYFDGTANGTSVNYITNLGAQTNLVGLLVSFFGQNGVLTCTDSGFPAYGGRTMRAAHQSFKVGPGEFTTFNDVLIGVATAAGVSAADTTAVRNVLESTRGDICNTPACTGGSSTSGGTSGPVQPTTIFVLNVQPKSTHPWTDGNTVGYKIDGVEGGGVTLTAGRLYGFQNMAPCAHPVYVSTSDQGAGSAEVPDGLSYPGGNPFGGCNGATVFFTPTTAQIGTALYYQCQVHLRMGGPLTIVSPGTPPTSSSSSTSGGVSGTSTTGEEVPGSGAFAAPAFILLAMCLFFML